jgi:hypothetical protein
LLKRRFLRKPRKRALHDRRVGIDEKSFGCGQSYVTLMSDLDAGRVRAAVLQTKPLE